jgi:hypothetical protein
MCGCTGGCSCNSVALPIGPTGPAGTNGINGTNGENGLNGTSVIAVYNDQTGITTGSGTSEESLFLATIPADTWASLGNEVELYAYMNYQDNDIVTIRFKLGGLTKFTYVQQGAEGEKIIFRIKMSKDAADSQFWTIEKLAYGTTSSALLIGSCLIHTASSTAVTASSNAFQITGQNTSIGAGQLTLYKAILYKYTA